MQKLIIDLDGVQNLVDLTNEEITELPQIPIVPNPTRTVDKRRLRTALHRLGLLESLTAAINAAGIETIMQWEDTTVFHEDSQLVQALIQGLGWNAATVDSIFESAGSLS